MGRALATGAALGALAPPLPGSNAVHGLLLTWPGSGIALVSWALLKVPVTLPPAWAASAGEWFALWPPWW